MAKKTPRLTGPGYFGSTKAVKDSLKKSPAGEIRNLKDGDSLTIRFLEEPDKWFGYSQHWMSDNRPIPCVADDCEGCASDNQNERRVSQKYLANAYCADEDKVIAIQLPKSAAEIAFRAYEKRGTVMDRDYEFSRTGSGQQDTSYALDAEAPSKFTKKVKLKDLESLVMSMLGYDDEDDEDEEDERPTRAKRNKPRNTRNDDPYEDEDEDDEDEDDAPPPRRVKRTTTKKPVRTVRRKR